jgi:hypothetical protein
MQLTSSADASLNFGLPSTGNIGRARQRPAHWREEAEWRL